MSSPPTVRRPASGNPHRPRRTTRFGQLLLPAGQHLRCVCGSPVPSPSTPAPAAPAGAGSRFSLVAPETPSRVHQAPGSATPGPQPGCAGSASSAVSGVAVIAEEPARGACSVTTPSRSPSATTGPPDIPDHGESPSAAAPGGSGRGALLTCTDSNPLGQPRQHRHVTERVSGLPEPATTRRLSLHELRVADHMTSLHRVTRRAIPIHCRQRPSPAHRPRRR